MIERGDAGLQLAHARLQLFDPLGRGPSDRGGGPAQGLHLFGEVVHREEDGFPHHQLRRADATIARVDRRRRVHVGLLFEQRDRRSDVARIGGSQREPLGLCVQLLEVSRGEIGALGSPASGSRDLGALVFVRKGVGNAIVHRVGR